jgi:predicted RNase H-like HicB family nuclease
MPTSFKYVVYREGEYWVSQCLNVDVSSFGDTQEEAVKNLREAVELYLEDENLTDLYHEVSETMLGETSINA